MTLAFVLVQPHCATLFFLAIFKSWVQRRKSMLWCWWKSMVRYGAVVPDSLTFQGNNSNWTWLVSGWSKCGFLRHWTRMVFLFRLKTDELQVILTYFHIFWFGPQLCEDKLHTSCHLQHFQQTTLFRIGSNLWIGITELIQQFLTSWSFHTPQVISQPCTDTSSHCGIASLPFAMTHGSAMSLARRSALFAVRTACWNLILFGERFLLCRLVVASYSTLPYFSGILWKETCVAQCSMLWSSKGQRRTIYANRK